MSVSDPLIKQLKGWILKFMEILKDKEINDENEYLQEFCSCLERIFTKGLVVKCNSLGFPRQTEAWIWMSKIATLQNTCISMTYKTVVERVRSFPCVTTNSGRLRLLLRSCLVHRCLHVPIQTLASTKIIHHFYDPISSIIGDEILREITLSLVLQCANLKFNLTLSKASFLDETWLLPQYETFELIPCLSLGISVTFVNGKAVIVDIKPSSVAEDENKFEIGDILEELNGHPVTSAMQGKLSSIMRNGIGKPIKVRIIKARYKNTKDIYTPIVNLLKQLNINLDIIDNNLKTGQILNNHSNDDDIENIIRKNTCRAGYGVTYVGNVTTGKHGEVKQIEKAIRMLLSQRNITNNNEDNVVTRIKKKVFIEIQEIGIRIVDAENGNVILNHSYMEIASCGSTSNLHGYFAYIAGDKYCNISKKFTCYIFSTSCEETLQFILHSIEPSLHAMILNISPILGPIIFRFIAYTPKDSNEHITLFKTILRDFNVCKQ